MYALRRPHCGTRAIRGVAAVLVVAFCLPGPGFAQPKYRTFAQDDLALKKAKAGKIAGSIVRFTFVNPRLTPVHGFHATISKKIISIRDSGGFTSFKMKGSRTIDGQGGLIAGGDSVTMEFLVNNNKPGTIVNYFWWTDETGGRRSNTTTSIVPAVDERLYVQPNGGNLREYIYKKVLTRPDGLVLGVVAPDQDVGWIRNMSANGRYFPHTGTPRCLDVTVSSSGRTKAITGQLRNLHYKKHDNRLLGELHTLKLAIIANDAGVTEPTDPNETRLGDLLYNDGGNPDDPFNGLTLRGAAHLVDSALTFCGNFDPSVYARLDSGISRINTAFDGPYVASSFDPFVLEGSATLEQALYLHPNPDPPPARIEVADRSIVEVLPETWSLAQNYPNPFNPTTSIEFSLAQPGIVNLKVYDLLGREVAALIDGEEYDEGGQLVNFDAESLTSGIYFYRLTVKGTGEAGGYFDQIGRMTLIR